MNDPTLRNIFGLSLTAAYIRGQYLNMPLQPLCEAFAVAFGMEISDGDGMFTYLSNLPNLNSTLGINAGTDYTSYESNIYNIINNYITDNPTNIQNLAVAVNALIFAYSLNSNIPVSKIYDIIGLLLVNIGIYVNNSQQFQIIDTFIVQPFSENLIIGLISNNYIPVINNISNSIKSTDAPATNYNWYNTANLFSNPNLQTMKDIESQYYYISGKLIYQSAVGNLVDCIEDTITINTHTGTINTTYIRNVPCIDKTNYPYFGPINGIEFNRIFSDGPSSSGYMTSGIISGYESFDQSVLQPNDYQCNQTFLYALLSNNTGFVPIFTGPAWTDTNGEYSLLQEYQNVPISVINCTPYQTMHVGDNAMRAFCSFNNMGDCICVTGNYTGFKYVTLELNSGLWANNFNYYQTNPVGTVGRVLKRAWEIDSNPYLATQVENSFFPFYFVGIHDTKVQYIGPPQLQGGNTLPMIAFFESFDNQTFGTHSSLVMYPSLGTSLGNTGISSDRTYSISAYPIFSGINSAHFSYETPDLNKITFIKTISSATTGVDSIFKKFFGMGDNFGNQYKLNVYQEQNAGFLYSGYLFMSGNSGINSINLISNYSNYILGASAPIFNYISGYTTPDGNVSINKIYGKNNTGGLELYYYIDNRLVPTLTEQVPQSGWTNFAPIPSSYITNNYTPVSGQMNVENYFPRYWEGPFSDETHVFLYPNAVVANNIYQSKTVGFPTQITFTLVIREETVREFFGYYKIYPNGLVDTQPTYIPVLRAGNNGSIVTGIIMNNIFLPNTIGGSQYDFNNFNTGSNYLISNVNSNSVINITPTTMVDNSYSPTYYNNIVGQFVTPSGKNNFVYNGFPFGPDSTNIKPTFYQGILQTGYQSYENFFATGPTSYVTLYPEIQECFGLFHQFWASQFNVSGFYVLPLYNIASGEPVITQQLQNAFTGIPALANESLRFSFANGQYGIISGAFDPIFMENVGGRIGGPDASIDGGYHSYGIIGDEWLAFLAQNYGINNFSNVCDSVGKIDSVRDPSLDNTVCLFNMTPTGTIIYAQGLQYTPFHFIKTTSQFTSKPSINYIANGQTYALPITGFLNGCAMFDLSKLMSILTISSVNNNTNYYTDDLLIGPFDRDVELGMFAGNTITAYNQLWLNGNQLTDYPNGTCLFDVSHGDILAMSNIQCGEGNRNANYTILGIAPSGGYFNLNCIAEPNTTEIGILPRANVIIKSHNNLYEDQYDSNLFLGEEGWLDSSQWVDNLLYNKYVISHNNFNGLEGNHTYINPSRSGKLYPQPGSDFTGMGKTDKYGNIIYPSTATVESYWKQYAIKNNVTILISGVREGSRVSFDITNLNLNFDAIPYQTYRVVVPSGNCIVSGVMGYNSQAEASIYTAGIELVNTTANDPISGLYNPIYVSNVLGRVPFFSFPPNGNAIAPLYLAPSIMEQRSNIPIIQDNQTYIGLLTDAPYNYNELLWPALSDLETLNAGETIESIPPDDGQTFTLSTMLFSASQGQPLPNGLFNPKINKTYSVANAYQMYDSLSTDAIVNSGKCLTNNRGTQVQLTQNTNLITAIAAQGTPLSLVLAGLQ